MSSLTNEPPIRRHLKAEVAMLLQQAARAARERMLRRLAVLGGRQAMDEVSVGVDAARAVGEAAAVQPLNLSPGAVPRPVSEDVPAVGSGARADLPTARPWSVQPAAVEPGAGVAGQKALASPVAPAPVSQPADSQAPPSRPAVAAVPPMTRLMRAAALQAERAEALEHEALLGWPEVGVTPEERLVITGRAPRNVTELHRERGRTIKAVDAAAAAYRHGPLPGPDTGAPPHGTLPETSALPGRPLAEKRFQPTPAAPFGPHPAAPGPAPAAAPEADHGGGQRPANSMAPVYHESDLLAEARLREQLARILRADGLRHGLDLKER